MIKTILVVDDRKNIRKLLATCLEAEGYTVFSANDGPQALEMFLSQPFDLAFLDIKLPEISGTEVLRRIREMGIKTPVIIMTAFATVRNAVECTKLGAIAYLQKPFTAEKVRNVLQDINKKITEPANPMSLNTELIRTMITNGNMDTAYQQLTEALGRNPNNQTAYYLLARIYEAQGKEKEAHRFDMIAKQF